MKEIINKIQLKEILKKHWSIDANKIIDAPRGFVAETFFVKSDQGELFVKVIDATSRYIENVLESLPVISEMRSLGVLDILEVIRTVQNTFAYKDSNVVVIVFNKIQGEPTWDYNKDSYYELLKKIHSLNPNKFQTQIKRESFGFLFEKELVRNVKVLRQREDIQKLAELSSEYLLEIDEIIEKFRIVILLCRDSKFDLRITHGDALGNIIVGNNNKLYLIDWDDLLLAPIERDLWYHEGESLILKYYPDYQRSELAYSYYLLRRFLDDFSGFLDEIFKSSATEDDILENAKGIKNDVIGWLLPLVRKLKLIDKK